MKIAITIVVTLALLGHAVFVSSQTHAPDLILVNGKIFTSNAAQPYVQALAIRGERVTAVGTAEQMKELAKPTTKIIDLGGRTVIPGINDAHNHLSIAPQSRVDVHFKSLDPSWPEARQVLAAASEKAPKGAFIYGDIGPTIFHDVSVDRAALDKESLDHPVILTTFTGHGAIVNSAALAAARIAENQPDPLGGRYEHFSDGRLSGVLREYAVLGFNRTLANQVPDAAAVPQLRDTLNQAAKFGITTIQDMSDAMPPERCVALLEKIPTSIRVRVMRMPGTTPDGRDTHEGWPAPIVTNPLIHVSGTKWMLDGVPVEGTFTPRDKAGPAGELFMHLPLTFPKAELASMLQESLRNHDQLLLHVSGRPSAEAFLDSMRAAGKSLWSEKRVRFEHGDGLTPDLLPAVKEMGVIVVQNPSHLDGVDLIPGLGDSLNAVKAQPLKSLLDSGIPLALGSDGPTNPYLNIMFASLHPDRPSEAISREQAVIASTLTSAYAEFADKEKGSLEPGKLADLAVLSQDIFTVPASDLPKTTSVLTLVGGKVVYDANAIGPSNGEFVREANGAPKMSTGDALAEHIRVSFDPVPAEWVTEQNVMDPIWEPLGYKGVNYYAYGRPESGKSFAARSDPDSSLYQAWLGAYIIAGGKAAFGSGEKETQCSASAKLAEYDQRSWLEAMGDPHPLAESSTQRHFLTIPVGGSDRTGCSFDMTTHSDLSTADTPLAKHMGMPPAKDWQEQLAAFHDVRLHVVGAWWYDAQRDLTMIVYTASSTFRNRASMVKDNEPVIATSLRQIMTQVHVRDAGGSRQ
jgi:predicted amidohydrolase YtcJ